MRDIEPDGPWSRLEIAGLAVCVVLFVVAVYWLLTHLSNVATAVNP